MNNLEREEELNDLRALLQLPEGKRFLYRFLSECGLFHNQFSSEPHVTSFNCGKKDAGLWVTNEILDANPNQYYEILKLKNEEKENADRGE